MNGDGPGPPGGQLLFEAILNEQQAGWNRGERPSVEDFLARHPSLQENAEASLDVIYQEFVIRRARGESPCAEDYLRRFPAWSEALIRQFAVDEALRPFDGATLHAAGEPSTIQGSIPVAGETVAPAPARSIDGYEILGELGRGGMGIVFKALDRRLNRVVAIKTVSETTFTAPLQLRRFLAEAEVIARVRHPNIIPIYAVGEEHGRPYFSLELADRGNLSQQLAKGPLTGREAAVLVETLAKAVSAAHSAGIIHRDLKPSNVLLAHDGTPKIGDFGLAKLLGDDSASTLSGEVLGTPSYMAPEQADGRSREVGPAADIYALGAILYQALTGRPPFLGASAIETMRLVVNTEVVPPRRQRPDVPRDVETIALKCLEKDPRRRYADAGALSADLRRFLEGRPITARPVGPVGRLARWYRRNPALAATAAALFLTFLFGSPALLGLWLQARADRARALAERTRAVIERDHAERSRDRAIGAVDVLLRTENDELLTEELRPYRKAMIEAGLREALALVRKLEGDPRAEFQRFAAYSALVLTQKESGDTAAAIETAKKAIALGESLAARDPSNDRARLTLAGCLQRVAAIFPDEPSFQTAIERSSELLKSIPSQTADLDGETTRLTAMNHYNAGGALWAHGRYGEALAAFLEARAAYDAVIDAGDRSPRTLDLAGRNLLFLCRTFGRGRSNEARAAGERAESIFRSLVRDHPDRFEFGWQLYLVQEELGLLMTSAEQPIQAIPHLARARQTLEELAGRHGKLVSRMAQIQSSIAEVDFNLLNAYESDPVKYAAAIRELHAEAYDICHKLALVMPLSWNLRFVYGVTAFAVADQRALDGLSPDIGLMLESGRMWEEILRVNPEESFARGFLVVVRCRLSEELADSGQVEEASRWNRCSLETARGKPDLLYDLAGIYAQNAGLTGKLPTKLAAPQLAERRRRLTAQAVAMLRQAADDGLNDGARLRKDKSFDPIRSDPGFAAILADIEFPAHPFAPL